VSCWFRIFFPDTKVFYNAKSDFSRIFPVMLNHGWLDGEILQNFFIVLHFRIDYYLFQLLYDGKGEYTLIRWYYFISLRDPYSDLEKLESFCKFFPQVHFPIYHIYKSVSNSALVLINQGDSGTYFARCITSCVYLMWFSRETYKKYSFLLNEKQ